MRLTSKRVFSVTLCLALILCMVLPSQAVAYVDSNEPSLGCEVENQSNEESYSDGRYAGSEAKICFKVTNPTDFDITISDISLSLNKNGEIYNTENYLSCPESDTISAGGSVILTAGEEKDFIYTGTIPDDADDGAFLCFSLVGNDDTYEYYVQNQFMVCKNIDSEKVAEDDALVSFIAKNESEDNTLISSTTEDMSCDSEMINLVTDDEDGEEYSLYGMINPLSDLKSNSTVNLEVAFTNESSKDLTLTYYDASYMSADNTVKKYMAIDKYGEENISDNDYIDSVIELKTKDEKPLVGTVIPAGETVCFYGCVKLNKWNAIIYNGERHHSWIVVNVKADSDCIGTAVYAGGNIDTINFNGKKLGIRTNLDLLQTLLLTEEEKQQGTQIMIYVEPTIPEEVKKATKNAEVEIKNNEISTLSLNGKTYPIFFAMDITLSKMTIDNDIDTITQTDAPISFTFDVPEEYKDGNYEFFILRNHDGEVDILKDLDSDPNTITFETDKFSIFMLSAIEISKVDNTATTTTAVGAVRTGDTTNVVAIMAVMLLALGVSIVIIKKKHAQN